MKSLDLARLFAGLSADLPPTGTLAIRWPLHRDAVPQVLAIRRIDRIRRRRIARRRRLAECTFSH